MCVPKGETRYYPYYGLGSKSNGDSSNGQNEMVTAMATVTEMVMVMVTVAMAETVARMRFKDFLDIDNLKHAKIEEKPVKGFDGDYKELSIAKPSLMVVIKLTKS